MSLHNFHCVCAVCVVSFILHLLDSRTFLPFAVSFNVCSNFFFLVGARSLPTNAVVVAAFKYKWICGVYVERKRVREQFSWLAKRGINSTIIYLKMLTHKKYEHTLKIASKIWKLWFVDCQHCENRPEKCHILNECMCIVVDQFYIKKYTYIHAYTSKIYEKNWN